MNRSYTFAPSLRRSISDFAIHGTSDTPEAPNVVHWLSFKMKMKTNL